MTHGFDLNNPLVCEGVVGDGCGGGRIFYIEDDSLFAYDPESKESMKVFDDIVKPKQLSKAACIITVECEDDTIKFDLSQMKRVAT